MDVKNIKMHGDSVLLKREEEELSGVAKIYDGLYNQFSSKTSERGTVISIGPDSRVDIYIGDVVVFRPFTAIDVLDGHCIVASSEIVATVS